MKKTVLLSCIIIFALAFSACDKDSLSRCEGGDCEYTIFPDSQLEVIEDSVLQSINIVGGDKLVFRYQFEKDENANIADDEYWDWIYFEIDPSLERFSLEGAELAEINALYEYSCFCFGPFIYRITNGSISGTKDGDKWEVTVDVEIDRGEAGMVNKAFSNTFK